MKKIATIVMCAAAAALATMSFSQPAYADYEVTLKLAKPRSLPPDEPYMVLHYEMGGPRRMLGLTYYIALRLTPEAETTKLPSDDFDCDVDPSTLNINCTFKLRNRTKNELMEATVMIMGSRLKRDPAWKSPELALPLPRGVSEEVPPAEVDTEAPDDEGDAEMDVPDDAFESLPKPAVPTTAAEGDGTDTLSPALDAWAAEGGRFCSLGPGASMDISLLPMLALASAIILFGRKRSKK